MFELSPETLLAARLLQDAIAQIRRDLEISRPENPDPVPRVHTR